MENQILLQNEALWKRIQYFSLDDSSAGFPFSKKLAKEESWSADFAKKAIEEYKKFVYLCCVLPNGASPSEIVDKVWHLHLIYTQNYWEEFCPNILKQKLHHHPSKGGDVENSKHENWFLNTLDCYKKVFKQDAPKDIWLNEKKKQRPRPRWFKSIYIVLLLILLFSLSSCESDISGTFIIAFAGLLVFLILLKNIFSKNNNRNDSGDSSGFVGGGCGGSSSGCGGGGCGGCGGGS